MSHFSDFPSLSTLRGRRAFSLLELIAAMSVLAILSLIGVISYQNVKDTAADRTKETELSQVIRSAQADAVISGLDRATDPVVQAAGADFILTSGSGVQAQAESGSTGFVMLRDGDYPEPGWVRGVDYGPSTGPHEISYYIDPDPAETRIGFATMSTTGHCVFGVAHGNSAVTTRVVKDDLGAACSGRNALGAEDDPIYELPDEDYGPPVAPESLTVDGALTNEVTLSWGLSSSGDVANYGLSRDGVVVTSSIDPAATTFTDTGLNGGTEYIYRLFAIDNYGLESDPIGPVTALTRPEVPASLNANPAPGEIEVTWTPVSNADGYRVFSNTGMIYVGSDLSFSHTGLTGATNYSYQVAAYNTSGEGDISAPVTALTYPDAITGLAAVPVNGTTIDLSWNAASGVLDGYELYQAETATLGVNPLDTAISVATITDTNTDTYTVSGLDANTSYTFFMKAYNDTGDGPLSSGVEGLTYAAVPAAPTFESATTDTLTIEAPAVTADTFQVIVDGTVDATVAATGAPVPHTITGLTHGTDVTVQLAACNATGCSDLSAALDAPTLPNPPTAITDLEGDSEVTFAWVESNSTVVDGYRVYVDGSLTATLPLTDSYTLTGLTNGTDYDVTIAAYNSSGESAAADVNVTPIGVPNAPTGLAGDSRDSSVNLTWNAMTSTAAVPVDGYRIFVNGSLYAVVNGSTSSSRLVSGLTNGQSYSFQISAFNASGGTGLGEGPVSAPVVVTPQHPAPTAPLSVGLAASTRNARITWSAPSGGGPVASYSIVLYRSDTNAVVGSATRTVSQSRQVDISVPHSVMSLQNGRDVYARVTAVGTGGDSSPHAQSPTRRVWGTPYAPGSPSLAHSSGSLTASWGAVTSDRGATISKYRATATASGQTTRWCETTGTSCTISSLTNGVNYSVRVTLYSNGGNTYSGYSSATPRTRPSAPSVTLTAISSGNSTTSQLRCNITKGNSNGASITNTRCEIVGNTSRYCNANSGTSCTITISGGNNGSSYRVRARSWNSEGWGSWSGYSNYQRPYGNPIISNYSRSYDQNNASVFHYWHRTDRYVNWNGVYQNRNVYLECEWTTGVRPDEEPNFRQLYDINVSSSAGNAAWYGIDYQSHTAGGPNLKRDCDTRAYGQNPNGSNYVYSTVHSINNISSPNPNQFYLVDSYLIHGDLVAELAATNKTNLINLNLHPHNSVSAWNNEFGAFGDRIFRNDMAHIFVRCGGTYTGNDGDAINEAVWRGYYGGVGDPWQPFRTEWFKTVWDRVPKRSNGTCYGV